MTEDPRTQVEIRGLLQTDACKKFRSGHEALDVFLRCHAAKNQFRFSISSTYVAVVAANVIGYATITAGTINPRLVPSVTGDKLPSYKLVPVLLLARMAVAREFQRQTIGAQLLSRVCNLSLEMTSKFGCIGVTVDAKPDAVSYYKTYGFEPIPKTPEETEARSTNTLMFLHHDTIAD